MELSKIFAAAKAIEIGTWIPSPTFEGVQHCVRGSSNADARTLRNKLIDAVPRSERVGGRVPAAKLAEIDAQVLSEAIWLDVRGLTENGAPVDIQTAKSKLLDPDIGSLMRTDVLAAAAQVGEDELAAAEDDAKN